MKKVVLKNPTAVMTKNQGFFLCKLVKPNCRWTPAVEAMISEGITMQQAKDAIDMAKAGRNTGALQARVETIAILHGVEITAPKTVAAKAAPTIPQELLERVAELTAQNAELREATAGNSGESVEGMTWVRGHFRKSK